MQKQKNKLPVWIRIVLALCGVLLIGVLFVPMWRIDLEAPQYPEGLRMLIYPHKLGGDVEIINGLNHYIGMKTLHAEDFIEFTILPYIISAFAALFIGLAAWGNRKMMFVLLALFLAFGVLAMVDFWRWEYNYGHNLDPNAAIVVPGMAYQPPLIGFKQLLNFGAFSIPDIGGWIFVAVGIILLGCSVFEIVRLRKIRKGKLLGTVMLCLSAGTLFASCDVKPRALRSGTDNCHYCQMTITDLRFGAELITGKGKIFVFDDAKCAIGFITDKKVQPADLKDVYLSDYSGNNKLISIKTAHLYRSDDLRSPMGGNIAAFESMDSLQQYMKGKPGDRVIWDDLLK
jgi:copper chaperone NosL